MITPTLLLTLAVFGGISYFILKKYVFISPVDEKIDEAEQLHEEAEKAKNIDVEQYQQDKETVDRIKDLH